MTIIQETGHMWECQAVLCPNYIHAIKFTVNKLRLKIKQLAISIIKIFPDVSRSDGTISKQI